MKNEIYWLVTVSVFTSIMWIPVLLNLIARQGLMAAVGNREKPVELAPWAMRGERARQNAVQNLILFSAIVLACIVTESTTASTALAASVYFWARFIHYFSYVAGIILVRTLAFATGWMATLYIAYSTLV